MNIPDGLESFVIGKHIGSGQTRDVYEWLPDDNLVVKVAQDTRGIIDNTAEFSLWESAVSPGSFYKDLKLILAPIDCISDCCKFLLMKKTVPVSPDEVPPVVPSFMTDLKLSNIGFYDGRVVFHDYAMTLLVEDAISLRKAKIVKKDSWT